MDYSAVKVLGFFGTDKKNLIILDKSCEWNEIKKKVKKNLRLKLSRFVFVLTRIGTPKNRQWLNSFQDFYGKTFNECRHFWKHIKTYRKNETFTFRTISFSVFLLCWHSLKNMLWNSSRVINIFRECRKAEYLFQMKLQIC